jgi:hypothetical protein
MRSNRTYELFGHWGGKGGGLCPYDVDRHWDGDGTFRWDSTTLIICEIHAAGEIGFGYSYGIQATAFVADYLAGKFLLQLTRASLDTAAEGALPTTMGNSLRSCLAGWEKVRKSAFLSSWLAQQGTSLRIER